MHTPAIILKDRLYEIIRGTWSEGKRVAQRGLAAATKQDVGSCRAGAALVGRE